MKGKSVLTISEYERNSMKFREIYNGFISGTLPKLYLTYSHFSGPGFLITGIVTNVYDGVEKHIGNHPDTPLKQVELDPYVELVINRDGGILRETQILDKEAINT